MARGIKSNSTIIRKELRLTHTEIINLFRLKGLDIGDFQDLEVRSSLDGGFDQFRFSLKAGDEIIFGFIRFKPAEETITGEGDVCVDTSDSTEE